MFQITDDNVMWRNRDGDKTATVFDPENNKIITRTDPFTVSEGCVARPHWQMAICPPVYGKVRLHYYDKS